ncbi:CRISPR-associated protein, Cmr2 family [Deinococcus geothermalis DSM 11300]|uniref:CRISPR-associated protein, Cmr2 family n=1 Tax=Deinococcus geothermalis (strain DSM 11300 / CIP 105573 / AG-3a) TaxID=319795 RepID=Q1IZS0_DEIGD|nr:type III-B CRISPR-associated protein Cas10/Cmr2 [Deinococcus geothermalis]ABF45264.1 CRISPR-associated protein, Cmr2 family [Deinococcus geothermalis DSM 11300]MBI0444547.1 type III-B CRISPR-associated protein Cas10/Cmr2 [Deinococcus sp. DB0503]
MTRHLLSLSLGPVQEFIAAARKTADLEAGSTLLVELVGAAASEFSAEERIYPASVEAGGANKILAVVTGDPAQHARRARARAQAELEAQWELYSRPLAAHIDEARARAQLAHFLEFYAAWVPLRSEGDYPAARRRVEALLAARKALRDFAPLAQGDARLPKSPLDPAYATVLRVDDRGQLPEALQGEPWNFKPTETLDAISLLKRLRGRAQRDVLDTPTLAHRAQYPGTVLQRSADKDPQPASAYYAILVADGDSMGALLSAHDSEAAHHELSRRLDEFARQARRIVQKHDGQAVFAGGDDVLAFLPVTTALACGRELAEKFRHTVRATLSAGIAVVHYREPLSTSLRQAREAEKVAKKVDGKNAVCVAVHTRGGAPRRVAQKWDGTRALEELTRMRLPRGLPYELSELAREWPHGVSPVALSNEARRIARRKATADGARLDESVLRGWQFDSPEHLREFANLLIIARFLSGQGDRA